LGLARWYFLQRRQSISHVDQVGCAVGSKGEITAPKQLETNVRFKLADSVVNRACGDEKLLGGAARTAKPRNCLESDQALNRWDVLDRHSLPANHLETVSKRP